MINYSRRGNLARQPLEHQIQNFTDETLPLDARWRKWARAEESKRSREFVYNLINENV